MTYGTPTPKAEDIESMEDVYDLLVNVGNRDIKSISLPDGQTVRFRFEDPFDYQEYYLLEINLHGPRVWLHSSALAERGTETAWENKCRRLNR